MLERIRWSLWIALRIFRSKALGILRNVAPLGCTMVSGRG
jgi:hypothetical protein